MKTPTTRGSPARFPGQKTKVDRQLQKCFSTAWNGAECVSVEAAIDAVKKGAKISLPFSKDGLSPFLRACVIPRAAPLVEAMINRQERCLPAAESIDLRDHLGRTGLHLAASVGLEDRFPILIAAGMLETQDNTGETPVASAIDARQFSAALRLVQLGANLLAEDHSKVGALAKIRKLCLVDKGRWRETLIPRDSASVEALLEIGYALLERGEMMSGVGRGASEKGVPDASGGNLAVSPARRPRL